MQADANLDRRNEPVNGESVKQYDKAVVGSDREEIRMSFRKPSKGERGLKWIGIT